MILAFDICTNVLKIHCPKNVTMLFTFEKPFKYHHSVLEIQRPKQDHVLKIQACMH